MNFDNAWQILVGIGAIIFGLSSFWGQLRNGGLAGLKESNETLRTLLKDKNTEITTLQDNHQKALESIQSKSEQSIKDVAELTGRIKQLSEHSSTLESLIVTSLESYWKNHPNDAAGAYAIVGSDNQLKPAK